MVWAQASEPGTGSSQQIIDAHAALDSVDVPKGPLAVRAIEAAGIIDRLMHPKPPVAPAVTAPNLLRGVGTNSGSAHMVVAYAHYNPGVEVLVTAGSGEDEGSPRLKEMLDEVLALLPPDVEVRSQPSRILFPNGSRIQFRSPRRDGRGVQGMWPDLVWANDLSRHGEIELAEGLKRMNGWLRGRSE